MKERPILFNGAMVRAILEGRKTQTRRVVKNPVGDGTKENPLRMDLMKSPYGKVGGELWVRETFMVTPGETVIYAANWRDDAIARGLDNIPDEVDWKWTPSIFMFRRYSRIQLRITDLRVERLQDISHRDALAEGVDYDVSQPDGAPRRRPHRAGLRQLKGPRHDR